MPSYTALPHEAGCGEEGALVCAGGHIAGRQGVALDDLVYIMTRCGRGVEGGVRAVNISARSARSHTRASNSSRFTLGYRPIETHGHRTHAVLCSHPLPFPRIARQTESDGIDKVFAAADSAAQLMEAASPLLQQATELVEQLTPLMAELRGGGLVGGGRAWRGACGSKVVS